jgi:hypothetical protein
MLWRGVPSRLLAASNEPDFRTISELRAIIGGI